MVPGVRRSNLVCSRNSRPAQKIRVSIGPRELNANWLEVLSVEGTINHVAGEPGAVHRIPAHFRVPVITDRPHIPGHRQRCLCTLRGIVVNPNFIDDESVPRAIGASLMKNDILQIFRTEWVDRTAVEFGQRDAHLNPAPRGQIARELTHRQRIGERSRKLGDLQTLTPGREHYPRKVVRGKRLWSKTPEIEIVSRHFRKTVAKVDQPHFGFPPPTGLRLPLEAESIRRRQKSLGVDRQPPVFLLKKTGPIRCTRTVEVGIRGQTVVENRVAIIVRVRPYASANAKHGEQQKPANLFRRPRFTFPEFQQLQPQGSIKVRRAGVNRPFYGTISISAAVPWAESGLIQTLSLAGSAAN